MPPIPPERRGAHYVTHQPSQSLTGSQLKESGGWGEGGVTWSREACLPQQGPNEGEIDCEDREREEEKFFPPTHSQLFSHATLPTAIAMETPRERESTLHSEPLRREGHGAFPAAQYASAGRRFDPLQYVQRHFTQLYGESP